MSDDGLWALSGSKDRSIRLWQLDWEYEFPGWADWDDGAEPYLKMFLNLHGPAWTPEQFDRLMADLSHCGYGWLRREGVGRKLAELADANHPTDRLLR